MKHKKDKSLAASVPAASESALRGDSLSAGYEAQPRGETYTSVSRHGLQKAFALAHRLSENPRVPNEHRAQFRAIAYLIWQAHGEPGTPPAGSGEILWETFSAWDGPSTRTSDPTPASLPNSNTKES